MAENPLLTLTRVLGGVILTQGRLGHQVLGQMLIMGSHEVAVAGASVVVAASSRQKNAVAQMALRTAAPALAVRLLLNKQEKRLALARHRLDEDRRRAERLHAERMRASAAIAAPAVAPAVAPAAAPAAGPAVAGAAGRAATPGRTSAAGRTSARGRAGAPMDIPPVDERLDKASAEIVALRKERLDLQLKLARLAARQKGPKAPATKPRKRKGKRR